MSVSLKTVVFVQTRKPASLAALMPSIAGSKTPSRSTAMSCDFRIPSRWTLKKKRVRRLELVDLLADEHAVGAEVDDLLALEDLGRQLADAGVDHRLAAADRDDRGAALVDGVEALLDRELLLDRRLVLADPPAAGAGQVAGVERFEHQDHREPLGPRQLLLGDVAGDPGVISSGNRMASAASLVQVDPARVAEVTVGAGSVDDVGSSSVTVRQTSSDRGCRRDRGRRRAPGRGWRPGRASRPTAAW